MKLVSWLACAVLALAVGAGSGLASDQAATSAADKPAAEAVLEAQKAAALQGVEFEKAFEMTDARELAALGLVEAAGEGAACSVTCSSPSGPKVGGIVCPVGKMCQCSCAGGGPDCTCRYSGS